MKPRLGQGGTKRSEGGREVKESEMGEDTLGGGDMELGQDILVA